MRFAFIVPVLLAHVRPPAPGKDFTPEALAFYEKDVLPILKANCFKCHGDGKAQGRPAASTRRDGDPQGRRPRPGRVARQARREPCCSRRSTTRTAWRCRRPASCKPEQIETLTQVGQGRPADDARHGRGRAEARAQGRRGHGRGRGTTGPTAGQAARRSRRSRTPPGSQPDRRLHPGEAGGEGPDARPPPADRVALIRRALLRPDRPAADAGGGRRVRRRHVARRLREGWSTGCSRRRTTARSGAGTGSTWSATPRPTATSATAPSRTPGGTATTSSAASTTTSRTTGSSASSSPATSSTGDDPDAVIATGLLPARPVGRRAGRPAAGAVRRAATTSSRRPARCSSA